MSLSLQVFGKTVIGEQGTAYFSFINPLPVALEDGVYTLEGSGLLHANIKVKQVSDSQQSLHSKDTN